MQTKENFMQTKRTIQGEAWDILAKSKYGSEYEMHTLLAENPSCLDTLLFSGNIPVNVPEKEKTTVKIPATWE